MVGEMVDLLFPLLSNHTTAAPGTHATARETRWNFVNAHQSSVFLLCDEDATSLGAGKEMGKFDQ